MRAMHLLCREQEVGERKREQREQLVDAACGVGLRRSRRDRDAGAAHANGRWRASRGRRTIDVGVNANGMGTL